MRFYVLPNTREDSDAYASSEEDDGNVANLTEVIVLRICLMLVALRFIIKQQEDTDWSDPGSDSSQTEASATDQSEDEVDGNLLSLFVGKRRQARSGSQSDFCAPQLFGTQRASKRVVRPPRNEDYVFFND